MELKILIDYIEYMDSIKAHNDRWLRDSIYDNFDWYKALRFNRVWDIIKNDLKPNKRTLFCIFMAVDCDADKALKLFNECGGRFGNIYSLRTETQRIKRKIIEIYNDKYGTN